MPQRKPKAESERRAPTSEHASEMEKSLEGIFGPIKGSEAEQLVPKLAEHKAAIESWLSASPRNADAFRREPLKALAKAFPELGVQTRPHDRASELGDRVHITGLGDAPDPAVLALFVKVWNYLAAGAADIASFRANPTGVITSLGQDQPESVVTAVLNAFRLNGAGHSGFGRLIGEAIEKGDIDPAGPVEAAVIDETAVTTAAQFLREV